MRHLEDSLQLAVADYLRLQYPSLLWWHTANGMYASGDKKKRGQTVNRFKRMGMRPGVADIVMFWEGVFPSWGGGIPFPRMGAIELKTGKNNLQDNQVVFRKDWMLAGGLYAVCRSVDDVQRQLEEWCVPKGRASQ